MSALSSPPREGRGRRKRLALLVLVGAGAVLAVAFGRKYLLPGAPAEPPVPKVPRKLAAGKNLTVWWDVLPTALAGESAPAGDGSNVRPADYAGPQACQACHPRNYQSWSTHPHRWMNVPADEQTVRGDFSGASMAYRGGRTTFCRDGGRYLMRLERDGERRVYQVNQTIGSRFFQYYVGKQLEGPEPPAHHFYHENHVLPFGYWLALGEWVPVIHIGSEVPDGQRPDPFAPPEDGRYYAAYARSCNYCHTTFALGDLLSRRPQQLGEHAPRPLHWSLRPYLEETRPEEVPALERVLRGGVGGREAPLLDWEAEHYAVSFGVSCEACHLGAREHVASNGKIRPRFFPASPHLRVAGDGPPPDPGRGHDNVNWACGRCHTGVRPTFAAGMSTWNSVEYDDAMRGGCYSKLRCVDCHDPHQPIGPRWARSAEQDDALCLRCHEHYRPAAARQRHTHHAAGSDGARCMNCHMPRLNEGVEDVVRTHMIYSPTRADMIEANHPNACNLCHPDRPIDWTLRHLKAWYGATYNESRVAASYPDRTKSVGAGWLRSDNASVRLVAVEAMARAGNPADLPHLLGALDDPYLVNRQFAYKELQKRIGLRLADLGYHFYLTASERRRPLAELRARLWPDKPPSPSPNK